MEEQNMTQIAAQIRREIDEAGDFPHKNSELRQMCIDLHYDCLVALRVMLDDDTSGKKKLTADDLCLILDVTGKYGVGLLVTILTEDQL